MIYNPWRESIENILSGDNYFRAGEWYELLDELDRLYTLEFKLKESEGEANANSV